MKSNMKLQLFLSHNRICSRRRALEIIQQGSVKVNGKVVEEPSVQIDPQKDKIVVAGKPVSVKSYEYILLNKPKGFVTTTSDRFDEKTVIDLLPAQFKHLVPVGRLDKDTLGLLLLTNDGDVHFKLTHPQFNIDKTYFARILGTLKPQEKKQLEEGIVIEGKKTSPAQVKNVKIIGKTTEFFMVIHEGRKRQIRLMVDALGHKVVYLKRVSQGPLQLGGLKTGCWRQLSYKEIEVLKRV